MAKPKLGLIPAAQGTKFYSVLPSNGTGDFDFTRGSSATRINAQGLIETVPNTSSRLNYPLLDGKVVGCPHHLLEPARTNQIVNNINSDLYSFQLITLSNNQGISPDGTLNAFKAVPTTISNQHLFFKTGMGNQADTYTQSVYAKADGYNFCYIRFDTPTNYAFFDLVNGIVSFSHSPIEAKIQNVGNGWFRCIATMTTTSYANAVLGVSDNGLEATMLGDGVSGVLFYGHQSELGDYETSLIITPTNATVTRLAETCTNAGNSDTFNDSEGVLMAEISALANDSSLRTITLGDNSSSNAVSIRLDNPNNITLYLNSGGASQCSFAANVPTLLFSKCLIKYKANDFSAWVNGFQIDVDTNGIVFPSGTLNRLNFDIGYTSTNPFYGNVKQVQYFDTTLTDTQLEELTSWDSFSDMANGQLYTIE